MINFCNAYFHYKRTKQKFVVGSTDDLYKILLTTPAICQSLNWLDISNLSSLDSVFANTEFNGDISEWDVSNIITMHCTFACDFDNPSIKRWKNLNENLKLEATFAFSKIQGEIPWVKEHMIDRNAFYKASCYPTKDSTNP